MRNTAWSSLIRKAIPIILVVLFVICYLGSAFAEEFLERAFPGLSAVLDIIKYPAFLLILALFNVFYKPKFILDEDSLLGFGAWAVMMTAIIATYLFLYDIILSVAIEFTMLSMLAWLLWHFFGSFLARKLAFPLHVRSIPKITGKVVSVDQRKNILQRLLKVKVEEGYFLTSRKSRSKGLISVLKASVFPLLLIIGISLPIGQAIGQLGGVNLATPSPESVFAYMFIAIEVVLPLTVLFIPPIWILQRSGLRYYDQKSETVEKIATEYSGWVKGYAGIGTLVSFVTLIATASGGQLEMLEFLLYLIFIGIYPFVFLVTLLYINFSEDWGAAITDEKLQKRGIRQFKLPPPVLTKKYCIHCGAEISSDATFCLKCGKKQA